MGGSALSPLLTLSSPLSFSSSVYLILSPLLVLMLQEPTPGTCVTVCGTTAPDACAEACQRAVCVNLHQVMTWRMTWHIT